MNGSSATMAFYSETIRRMLHELFPKVGRHPSEPMWLVTNGEINVHVSLKAWGDMDGVVRVLTPAPVPLPQDATVLRRLLLLNSQMTLANASADEDGNLLFSTEFLASSCSREQLKIAVNAVSMAADSLTSRLNQGSPGMQQAQAPSATAPQGAPPAETDDGPRIRLDELEIYYCIRGLPISAAEVWQKLQAGKSEHDLLSEYPDLELADFEALHAFAKAQPEALKPTPAPKVEEEPPAPKATPKKPPAANKPRIWPDDFGLYYSIRGLPISAASVYWKMEEGASDEALLQAHPELEAADLNAVRDFAAKHPDIMEKEKPAPVKAKVEPEEDEVPLHMRVPKHVQPPKAVMQPKKVAKPRIAPDEMGLYYSIRGLPISVESVLEKMEQGKSDEEILEIYPDLEAEDLDAVREFLRNQ